MLYIIQTITAYQHSVPTKCLLKDVPTYLPGRKYEDAGSYNLDKQQTILLHMEKGLEIHNICIENSQKIYLYCARLHVYFVL